MNKQTNPKFGSLRGVMTKMLHCNLEVSEFKL